MNYSVCLLAAGKGTRTTLKYNKVFYHLNKSQTVLDTILNQFIMDPDCKQIIVTASEMEEEMMKEMLLPKDPRIEVVVGGASRQESVFHALNHVKEDIVLIHDAARPYLKKKNLEDLKTIMQTEKAALLMTEAVDTIKRVNEDGYIEETIPRNTIWYAQTPQAFNTNLIKECHIKAREKGVEATDDAQLVELFGNIPVKCVKGDPSNTKITNPSDLKKES